MESTKAMQSQTLLLLLIMCPWAQHLTLVLSACLAGSLMSPVAEKHTNAECLFQDRCNCQRANEQVNLLKNQL